MSTFKKQPRGKHLQAARRAVHEYYWDSRELYALGILATLVLVVCQLVWSVLQLEFVALLSAYVMILMGLCFYFGHEWSVDAEYHAHTVRLLQECTDDELVEVVKRIPDLYYIKHLK